MAQCLICNEKVKHQWEHKECQVKSIVKEKNKWFYPIVKKAYPELVEKYEKIYNNK